MPNRRRGEVALVLGGVRYTLCLTLGALAELEDGLGAEDLAALAERFARGRPAARDLLTVLTAGLRGGGHALTEAEVAALPLDGGVEAVAEAIADLILAAFGGGGDPAHPPQGA